MASASMIGVKLPMFVIGKAKQPRCFRRIKKPCTYPGEKESWMDSEHFEEWIRDPVVGNLKSIDLNSLPPNTTSSLQPMDQGLFVH